MLTSRERISFCGPLFVKSHKCLIGINLPGGSNLSSGMMALTSNQKGVFERMEIIRHPPGVTGITEETEYLFGIPEHPDGMRSALGKVWIAVSSGARRKAD